MAHRSIVRRSSATVVRSPLLMFFRRRNVRPQEPDRPATSEPLIGTPLPLSGVAATTEPRNVPLPAGFVTADDWQWSRGCMPYRFVFTDWTVTDHRVAVSMHAFQWADGALADGTGAEGYGVEAPSISVLDAIGHSMNSDQARELAAALLAAAAELDGLEGTR
jgi:hypothetical protein